MRKVESITVGDNARFIVSAENLYENCKESFVLNISVGGRCCFHGELSISEITTDDIKKISNTFLTLLEQIKNEK